MFVGTTVHNLIEVTTSIIEDVPLVTVSFGAGVTELFDLTPDAARNLASALLAATTPAYGGSGREPSMHGSGILHFMAFDVHFLGKVASLSRCQIAPGTPQPDRRVEPMR